MNRFDRQVILPDFGHEGQEKLKQAHVLVVGAGGLGCPALLYLSAAGMGRITVADGDVVSTSNLNRQILFGKNDVGKPKAETAANFIKKRYPDVEIRPFPQHLNSQNLLPVLENVDIVVDGSDNFPTRYMINDAAVLLNKPLISGAIYQSEGQIAVLNFGEHPANYRDIFPEMPKAGEIPNCNETGVLGVLPGIIGTMQAAEAIKVITGYGKSLRNRLLTYNLKTASFYEVNIQPGRSDFSGFNRETFLRREYTFSCPADLSISWEEAFALQKHADAVLVDIRERYETPHHQSSKIKAIPMSEFNMDLPILKTTDIIVFFCQTGMRSVTLGNYVKKLYPDKKFYSIKGGITHPASPIYMSHEPV